MAGIVQVAKNYQMKYRRFLNTHDHTVHTSAGCRCVFIRAAYVYTCCLLLVLSIGCGKGPSALPGLSIKLTLENSTIQLAGGSTTAIATVTDGSLTPVTNAAVVIRCVDSQDNPIAGVVGPVENHYNGVYTARLANFPKADTYLITAATGQARDSKSLKVVGPGTGRLEVSVDPEVVPISQARTTVTVAAYDSEDKPWPGLTVTISIEPATGAQVGPVTDKGNGTYTAEITELTTAGTYTVTARAAGLQGTATLQVTGGPAVSIQGVVVANERDARLTYTDFKDVPDTRVATTGQRPNSLAVTSAKDRLLVANFKDATLTVFEVAPSGILNSLGPGIPVGKGPRHIAITPDNQWAFTANFSGNSISTVSLRTLQRSSSDVQVGNGPQALAVTPQGTKLLVANALDDNVSVLSFSSGTIGKAQDPVPVGKNPIDIVVTPNGTRALVANFLDNTVSVLGLDQGLVQKTQQDILVGRNPRAIALTPGGDIALVANFRDGTVSVLRVNEQGSVQTAQADVPVGSFPIDIVIVERDAALRAFVANYDSPTVSILSIDSQGTVSATGHVISLGQSPSAIACTY